MTTLYVSHPSGLDHHTGGLAERPERLLAIERGLAGPEFAALRRELAPKGTLETLLLVHASDYVEHVMAVAPREGFYRLSDTMVMSPGTLEAAMHGVGGVAFCVDEVMSGRVRNALLATRPNGHHAKYDAPGGGGMFNKAALAARHAQVAHGVGRVAILDFDAHHGDGAQDIFWGDPDVIACSTHEMPLYPGTGKARERGAHGQIVNVPLKAGDGGEVFLAAWRDVILPRVMEFRPDLIVIAAGFDAHGEDRLSHLELQDEDYASVTDAIMEVAEKVCGGRIVSEVEGGYRLEPLARSVRAHALALMGIHSDLVNHSRN